AMLIAAPPLLFCAVVAASGMWSFQNYRYISAGFPALLLVAGLALCPPRLPLPARLRAVLPARLAVILPAAMVGLAALTALAAVVTAPAPLSREMRFFAQGARDSNAQVVAIGRWVADNLPEDAHIAIHDAGAIPYYSERRITDLLGLVTNHMALDTNNGPGSRFEMIERIPADERPSHFAYYRGWLGTDDLYGERLLDTPLPARLDPDRRLVGGDNMQVYRARWDLLDSGHAPQAPHPGWSVVDRIDVADMRSEAEHDYWADMGRRSFPGRNERWSVYHRGPAQSGAGGATQMIADGGRPVRGPGGERFRIRVDPNLPVRLVMRSGGRGNVWVKPARTGQTAMVREIASGAVLGTLTLPRPSLRFHELSLDLPAGALSGTEVMLAVTPTESAAAADRPGGSGQGYLSYHYFVLQPAQ
ncbi:MAG: hypothetical protein AAGC55_27445, partial [Myxococcota bacterium]